MTPPGSRDARRAAWHEVPPTAALLDVWRQQGMTGPVRLWQRDFADGHLTAMLERDTSGVNGAALWHLSVSHRTNENPPRPGRMPRFDEVADARDLFLPADATIVIIVEPAARRRGAGAYPTILHLWECPAAAEMSR